MNQDIITSLAGGPALVRRSLTSLCQGRVRMDHGTYPDDLEFDDGYPNDARVDEIALVSMRDAARWLRDVFPCAVESTGYGRADVVPFQDGAHAMIRITVVTGGWSGAESIIWAALDHSSMRQYLTEEQRGGLYVFEVPE
jgi:hypothetical protein